MSDDEEFQSNRASIRPRLYYPSSRVLPHTVSENDIRRIWCLIEGEEKPFSVKAHVNGDIEQLTRGIQEERQFLREYDSTGIVLWKLNHSIRYNEFEPVTKKIPTSFTKICIEMEPPTRILSYFFPDYPLEGHLHIIIENPSFWHRPAKRHRGEGHEPAQEALPRTIKSPRIGRPQVVDAMAEALKPFTLYFQYLTEGKLDGYFTSVGPKPLTTDVGFGLHNRPMLLFHDLGKFPDDSRLPYLFTRDTAHLYAVSGSGKTRLSLEGLCHHWGFYISCRGGLTHRASGSGDFELATKAMEGMCGWNGSTEPSDDKNLEVSHRSFSMLICARIFILKHLLESMPSGIEEKVARQRWVLLQAMPPFTGSFFNLLDIFACVFKSLRQADTKDMLDLIESMTSDLTQLESFPIQEAFVIVADEAQMAADHMKDSFCSVTTGNDNRPVLHAFYRFLQETPINKIIKGVILAGTGSSKQMVIQAVNSRSAQKLESSPVPILFTDVGQFGKGDEEHEKYLSKYLLSLDPNSNSDRRLVERIVYWFSGRYRFTASLIELLLFTQPRSQSPHRILSAFAKSLTGFTITDALDLEDQEEPLSLTMESEIRRHGPVGTAELLFQRKDQIGLITCLLHAMMRWRIGSQGSVLIENYMYETISLGIGHLKKIRTDTLDSTIHPVYLCEPLAVLYLSSLFAKHDLTKESWIKQALCSTINQSRGFIFEQVVLFVLLQVFGGKVCALNEAFYTTQPWGSRKVTLVSLQRRSDGQVQSCPVSWTSGSSDRLGYNATSPVEVLNFLNNPNGKCFLFPDTHMGPDLACFLQDVETKEMILLLVQDKFLKDLKPGVLMNALNSVDPEFFYTFKDEDGERAQYAPSKYPGLSTDIMSVLGVTLGPAEYKPSVADCLKKLRSSTKLDEKFASLPRRETPRVIRIIATPDDNLDRFSGQEQKSDVGFLRWKCVEDCFGPVIRASMSASVSVA